MQSPALFVGADTDDLETKQAIDYLKRVRDEARNFPATLTHVPPLAGLHQNSSPWPIQTGAVRDPAHMPWEVWANWAAREFCVCQSSAKALAPYVKTDSDMPPFPKTMKNAASVEADVCSEKWVLFCSGQKPKLSLVCSLHQVQVVFLLEVLIEAVVGSLTEEEHQTVCMWIFALLQVLEKPLLAETQALLCDLSRCLQEDRRGSLVPTANILIVVLHKEFKQGRPTYRQSVHQ